MRCRKCGAVLLDTDTFCVKCGQKVDQPMFCSNCGEQLREGERFCHKCGSPVEHAAEDEEIPLSQQKTVDIPFDQIEQGILLEAEQAIVKRPQAERVERRDPEGYRQPGAQETGGSRQSPPIDRQGGYGQMPLREKAYDGDDNDEDDVYEAPAEHKRSAPVRPRYEEEYDDGYDEDEDDDEDSGGSGMKVVTIILGIIVAVVALVIGFLFWQRNSASRYERPEGQEEGTNPTDAEGGSEEEDAADTQGRIQILSNVNVRNAPTTDGSEVLMVAKQGETYEYYELVDNAWYRIKLEDGGEGYVSAQYVEDLDQ